ncbi:VanZ like family protein [Paenibacillus algorifonticola]|uniref:VanZ like family protein n=1 Tax=Paenibacillus algorifonticola TaxID=684063 RepID=A0A1I2DBG3_9BACL|nr:VanZ family protein [Paenibacillus algorifonticola]SFE77798.1 VanZ like family protein [Paenibacillus algorifonticola]
METRSNRYIIGIWLVILAAWILFVFHLSSQSFDQQTIRPKLQAWIGQEQLIRILPDLSITYLGKTIEAKANPYHFVEFIFRKSAHLFVYAMLGAIWFMLLRVVMKGRLLAPAMLSLLAAVSLAALDERNQLTSLNRTGNRMDVVVDFTGACIGIAVCLLLLAMVKLFYRKGRSR